MTAPSLFGDSGSADTDSLATEPIPSVPAHHARFAQTTSLYRKYRPRSFDGDELVGQEHVVRTLRNAILLDRVAHAYLFSGPRGTGKTTTARLLAKAINCLSDDPILRPCNACVNCQAINTGASPDIIEIDAASNRGIDDIRDLRDRVRYAPAQLPTKVYIIDEAHQITGAAANAFLKTLEEPPSHTRFILATTDPEELLPTIVSRCQRFEFRRVGADETMRRLRVVADLEGIAVDDDALLAIARHATGSLRDALGLLDRLALQTWTAGDADAPRAITTSDVQAALGLSHNDRVETLVAALAARQPGDALATVQEAIDAGEDPRQLNRQLLGYLRSLLRERSGGATEADERARALAASFSLEELARLARHFGDIDFSIKHAPYPQLPLEVALVEATTADSAASASGPPAREASLDQNQPENSRRPLNLRDRVRASSPIRDTLPEQSHPAQPRPNPVTPIRPVPAQPPASPVQASAPSSTALDVGQIADLWPRVRADVKALNRRIEALLSEVDPVAITGNQITLAVPYPFHRDKLNSDEVRETVAGVLSRLLEREVSLVCILRGEMAESPTHYAPEPEPAQPATQEPQAAGADNADGQDDEERAAARLRAAKNIFDAEEIETVAGNGHAAEE